MRRRARLDTCIDIDFPADEVAAAADEVAISSVTLAGLHYGVAVAGDPVQQMRRRQRVEALSDVFEILPFDALTAEYYGALAALVSQRGRNPRPRRVDLQIAATAAQHGLTLLIRNAADFAGLSAALTVIDVSRSSGR